MDHIRKLFEGRKSFWLVPLYAAFYIPWFIWLEKHVTTQYYMIHMAIDDIIPFCEYFIVFYFIWFVYMIAAVVFCVFTDRKTFFKSFAFIASGMTIFLIISTLFPNGHGLRPESFPRDNIFTDLVAFIYRADTSTNIFPSLHVYNAIGAHLSIVFNKCLKNRKGVKAFSLFICVGICLSTLFVKQHSMFDVIGAVVLSMIMYPICFREEYRSFVLSRRERRTESYSRGL